VLAGSLNTIILLHRASEARVLKLAVLAVARPPKSGTVQLTLLLYNTHTGPRASDHLNVMRKSSEKKKVEQGKITMPIKKGRLQGCNECVHQKP